MLIVVSPLLALIKDQVEKAAKFGLKAIRYDNETMQQIIGIVVGTKTILISDTQRKRYSYSILHPKSLITLECAGSLKNYMNKIILLGS